MATKIEIYPSGIGFKTGAMKFRWRLRAANNQIVATGHQGFVTRYNARRAARRAALLMRSCLVNPFAPIASELRPFRIRQLGRT